MKSPKRREQLRKGSEKYYSKKATERAQDVRCTKSPEELKVLWAKALRGGL